MKTSKQVSVTKGEPRSFESEEPIELVINGHRFILPGPLKAVADPQGTYHIRFLGEAFVHHNIKFRGTVSFQDNGTVYGNLAEGLTLTNAIPPRNLGPGAEVSISSLGMLMSKDTYMIEGDCTAKKCSQSRDLTRDPIQG